MKPIFAFCSLTRYLFTWRLILWQNSNSRSPWMALATAFLGIWATYNSPCLYNQSLRFPKLDETSNTWCPPFYFTGKPWVSGKGKEQSRLFRHTNEKECSARPRSQIPENIIIHLRKLSSSLKDWEKQKAMNKYSSIHYTKHDVMGTQCQKAHKFFAESRNLCVWVHQKKSQVTWIKSLCLTEVSAPPLPKLSLKFQNFINNQL